LDSFFKNNTSIVITFVASIFAAGGIFSEFTALKDELSMVHQRLDEKVLVMERIQQRVIELEKKTEYERGLLDARNKINEN
jgi:hypothetical protein